MNTLRNPRSPRRHVDGSTAPPPTWRPRLAAAFGGPPRAAVGHLGREAGPRRNQGWQRGVQDQPFAYICVPSVRPLWRLRPCLAAHSPIRGHPKGEAVLDPGTGPSMDAMVRRWSSAALWEAYRRDRDGRPIGGADGESAGRRLSGGCQRSAALVGAQRDSALSGAGHHHQATEALVAPGRRWRWKRWSVARRAGAATRRQGDRRKRGGQKRQWDRAAHRRDGRSSCFGQREFDDPLLTE